MGMPPIGGDGADLNSELTLAAIRTLAQDIERIAPEERLEAIVGSLGALVQISEIIAPQYREIAEYMAGHDADSDDHDERMLARVEGFIGWVNDLTPAEIVSLVAAAASLLDFTFRAGLDAPDEILELFEDGNQPDG